MTPETRVCRVCGCTDQNACAGGCGWIEPDLCSLCALAIEAIREWAARAVNPDLVALCAEVLEDHEPQDEPLVIIPGS
jgi:hypothetical protein